MITSTHLGTLLQIYGEGGNDWLIVTILVVLTVAALVWLFQRFRPHDRRQQVEGADRERERHPTGGSTQDAFRRRWNPRS